MQEDTNKLNQMLLNSPQYFIVLLRNGSKIKIVIFYTNGINEDSFTI